MEVCGLVYRTTAVSVLRCSSGSLPRAQLTGLATTAAPTDTQAPARMAGHKHVFTLVSGWFSHLPQGQC